MQVNFPRSGEDSPKSKGGSKYILQNDLIGIYFHNLRTKSGFGGHILQGYIFQHLHLTPKTAYS